MRFVCRYGHAHRKEAAREYCHIETDWSKKMEQIPFITWEVQGTTKEWFKAGPYRLWFWPGTAWQIMQRDKRKCQYNDCNITKDLAVHHIIPRRLGGSDDPRNLITLCHNHHNIQLAHHHNAGLILCKEDLEKEKAKLEEVCDPLQQTLQEF